MDAGAAISASAWAKGIALSVLASIVGGASKLAIRKSWLLQHQHEEEGRHTHRNRRRQQQQHRDVSNNNTLSEEEEGTITLSSTTTNSPTTSDDRLDLQEDFLLADERGGEEGSGLLLTRRNRGSCCCRSSSSADNDETDVSLPSWFPFALRYSGMLGMSVLNPICCVLAMNYASPSILAPFSGLTLCWVIMGSPCVNKEQPSLQQMLACALIIVGEVVVALFGDHTNDEGVTIDDVRRSYQEPAFLLYFVGLVAYVTLLAYWMKYSPNLVLRRFAWGSCGGSITGAQNFLKDSLTILKDATLQHQPLPWYFYLFIVSAAGTAFVGLLILTACMKRYDATYSAASFVGSFVVSASIMATAHYNTFAELHGLINYILYPTGLVVLMIGVYILSKESSVDIAIEEDHNDVVIQDVDGDDKEESEVRRKKQVIFGG
jgi:hypothetical protein